MGFNWPSRTQTHMKERISQVLWVLKLEGDIEDRGCAVRVLKDRLAAHGVEITAEAGFRTMLTEMEGGRYGELILRKINGRRTQGLYLLADELPPNYLPDFEDPDELGADTEPEEETFSRQTLFGQELASVPELDEPTAAEPAPVSPPPPPALTVVPAAVSAPAFDVDRQFDLIAESLESELDELRRPLPQVQRPSVKERIGQDRNLDDKAGVIGAILELVGDLAVMVAGEPTKTDADTAVLDRLADAVERAERFRRRALGAEETAVARKDEADGLRRQIADKEGEIARLRANVEALLKGERVADPHMVNAAHRFLAEKPHERRGNSELVYSTGG